MEGSASEFFKEFQKSDYRPALQGVQGTCRFDIGNAGSWRILMNDGKVEVDENREEADCVIACGEEDFIPIVNGKQNLLTAFLQGRVRLSGNLALAAAFNGLLPGPDA
jgi:putative sterol carrier protein